MRDVYANAKDPVDTAPAAAKTVHPCKRVCIISLDGPESVRCVGKVFDKREHHRPHRTTVTAQIAYPANVEKHLFFECSPPFPVEKYEFSCIRSFGYLV